MSGSTHNDGGPAFPRHYGTMSCAEKKEQLWSEGMTLRDYFAGQALMGILNNAGCFANMKDSDVAENAYHAADAMIKAREVAK